MCLIGIAIDPPGPWLLVLAANRDEFHDRSAAPAAYWGPGAPGLLGGRDLQGGGTWLGLRRMPHSDSLRLAALTNLRSGLMPASLPGPPAVLPSRGELVTGFLCANTGPGSYLHEFHPAAAAYAGFNLLALALRAARPQGAGGGGNGDADGGADAAAQVDAWYLNNLPGAQPRRLRAGVHLVSNATLDVPWPKTMLLRTALTAAIGPAQVVTAKATTHELHALELHALEKLREQLFVALADRTPASDQDLPQTGLNLGRERLLSAPFILDDFYGTRCSTVLVISRIGRVLFSERSFDRSGRHLDTVTEDFELGAEN